MPHPFIYVGCFVKHQDFYTAIKEIRKNPLENDIENPHITFTYKPIDVNQSLFGKPIQIVIVGYGNDGENEGLRVQLHSSNSLLQAMIEQLDVPHITISVGNEGKPVNTKKLLFEEIEPIEMIGKYGGFTKWGKVIVQQKKQ